MFPIIMGVSKPAYDDDELEYYKNYSNEEIDIDGVKKTRYEWTQEMRRTETALRWSKDKETALAWNNDDVGVAGCKAEQGRLKDYYMKISEQAKIDMQWNRTGRTGKAAFGEDDTTFGTIDKRKVERQIEPKFVSKRCEEIDKSQWIPGAIPNSSKSVIADDDFIDRDGKRYVNGTIDIDTGKTVKIVYDHSQNEKDIAEVIRRGIGGEVHLAPRVTTPHGIQCADYIIETSKGRFYVDYKELKTSGVNTVHNDVYNKRHQANHFILDISIVDIDQKTIEDNIIRLFNSYNARMVRSVVIVRNKKFVKVYRKK